MLGQASHLSLFPSQVYQPGLALRDLEKKTQVLQPSQLSQHHNCFSTCSVQGTTVRQEKAQLQLQEECDSPLYAMAPGLGWLGWWLVVTLVIWPQTGDLLSPSPKVPYLRQFLNQLLHKRHWRMPGAVDVPETRGPHDWPSLGAGSDP